MILKLLAAVVVAYLGWRMWHGFGRPMPGTPIPPPPAPSQPRDAVRAARALLGVGDDADAEAIRSAHRRLVAVNHPDRGGSAEITRQLNAARDTLLGDRPRLSGPGDDPAP